MHVPGALGQTPCMRNGNALSHADPAAMDHSDCLRHACGWRHDLAFVFAAIPILLARTHLKSQVQADRTWLHFALPRSSSAYPRHLVSAVGQTYVSAI